MKSKTFNSSMMPFLRVLLLAGFVFGLTPDAWSEAPKREFTKTINREFGTIANGMTALYNKYGKINVNTWQNNSVKIDITIVVNANEQRSADKMFDRIKFNFTSTAGYIKAETVIEQGNDWWPGESSCQDFKINYEVWMPAGNQLDLKNKYGNSYVGAMNNKLIAEIKYGDLRTETINGDIDLNMAYGNGTIAGVQNVYGSMSNGELSLGSTKDIQLDTKYSELSADRAGLVCITSKYDHFDIGSLTELRLQTKYSSMKVKQARSVYITGQYTDVAAGVISDIIDVDMSYGDLKVGSVGKTFSSVNINAKYTDVEVVTERGSAFRFNAEGSYTDLRYPGSATIRRRDESVNRETVEGYVGDANAKGLVKARLSYGDFVLK